MLQDGTTLSLTAQELSHSKQTAAHQSDVSAGAVFVLTLLMAAATCLGAVPFFFVGTLSTRWSALANAIACGVMLAASFDLVHEGEPYGGGLVIVGIMIGGSPSTHADIASQALWRAHSLSVHHLLYRYLWNLHLEADPDPQVSLIM